jgi:hypothetical protein
MDKIFLFIILCMATWRLSSLFAREDGPFDIFENIRLILYRAPKLIHKTLGLGIICVWCNSIWFSAIAALFIAHSIFEWVVFWLAISTGALIIERITDG